MIVQGLLTAVIAILTTAEEGRPLGVWERQLEDTEAVIEIKRDEIRFVVRVLEKGETTLEGHYDVAPDGILFGVFTRVHWAKDDQSIQSKQLAPFAFRFTISEDKLVLRDARLYGFDEKAHKNVPGAYARSKGKGEKESGKGKIGP